MYSMLEVIGGIVFIIGVGAVLSLVIAGIMTVFAWLFGKI